MKQNIFINKVLSLSDFELSSDQKKAVDLFADFLIEETESEGEEELKEEDLE